MSPRYHIVDNRKNVSVNHRNPNLLMSPRAHDKRLQTKRIITTGSPVSVVLWFQRRFSLFEPKDLGESMRERREEKRAPLVESVGNLTSMLGPKYRI